MDACTHGHTDWQQKTLYLDLCHTVVKMSAINKREINKKLISCAESYQFECRLPVMVGHVSSFTTPPSLPCQFSFHNTYPALPSHAVFLSLHTFYPHIWTQCQSPSQHLCHCPPNLCLPTYPTPLTLLFSPIDALLLMPFPFFSSVSISLPTPLTSIFPPVSPTLTNTSSFSVSFPRGERIGSGVRKQEEDKENSMCEGWIVRVVV